MRALAHPLLAGLHAGLAAAAYRGGAALAGHLPGPLARRAGRWLGIACWALQPGRRRALRENFLRLAPRAPATLEGCDRRAFGNFGEAVVDTLRLARVGPAELARRVRIEGAERLERAVAAGGAVLLAGHAGNWEWGGAALALRGFRVAAVARPHGPGAQRFFDSLRRRFGVTASPSLRALPAGRGPGLVAIFCDRPGPARLARPPERMARRALALAARRGLAAFPALVLRDAQGYRVVLGPELPPERAGRARESAARAALGFLAGHLDRHLDQWFAFEPARALP